MISSGQREAQGRNVVSESVQHVLDAALALSSADRSQVVDAILASLEPIEPELEAAWRREAEDRLAAYDAGLMEAIDAEDVLAEFDGL
jgi:putative addiction module component (TIGR02574 family)